MVYDHSFEGDRAWFGFAFKWTDSNSGEPRSRAGMQLYRLENGKLAETWLSMQPLGSVWPDAFGASNELPLTTSGPPG